MSRTIDLEEANNWSEAEARDNILYLRDRGRDAEADQVKRIRLGKTELGGGPTNTSETGVGDSAPELQDDDQHVNADQFIPRTSSEARKRAAKAAGVGSDDDSDDEDDEPTFEDTVRKGTVDEVLELVGDDPEKAREAFKIERQNKDRATLKEKLKEIVRSANSDDEEGGQE